MKKLNKRGMELVLNQTMILILIIAFAIFIISVILKSSRTIITSP